LLSPPSSDVKGDSLHECVERFLLCEHTGSLNILAALAGLAALGSERVARVLPLVPPTSRSNLPFKVLCVVGVALQLVQQLKSCERAVWVRASDKQSNANSNTAASTDTSKITSLSAPRPRNAVIGDSEEAPSLYRVVATSLSPSPLLSPPMVTRTPKPTGTHISTDSFTFPAQVTSAVPKVSLPLPQRATNLTRLDRMLGALGRVLVSAGMNVQLVSTMLDDAGSAGVLSGARGILLAVTALDALQPVLAALRVWWGRDRAMNIGPSNLVLGVQGSVAAAVLLATLLRRMRVIGVQSALAMTAPAAACIAAWYWAAFSHVRAEVQSVSPLTAEQLYTRSGNIDSHAASMGHPPLYSKASHIDHGSFTPYLPIAAGVSKPPPLRWNTHLPQQVCMLGALLFFARCTATTST
jgi:hypothetical protein